MKYTEFIDTMKKRYPVSDCRSVELSPEDLQNLNRQIGAMWAYEKLIISEVKEEDSDE